MQQCSLQSIPVISEPRPFQLLFLHTPLLFVSRGPAPAQSQRFRRTPSRTDSMFLLCRGLRRSFRRIPFEVLIVDNDLWMDVQPDMYEHQMHLGLCNSALNLDQPILPSSASSIYPIVTTSPLCRLFCNLRAHGSVTSKPRLCSDELNVPPPQHCHRGDRGPLHPWMFVAQGALVYLHRATHQLARSN